MRQSANIKIKGEKMRLIKFIGIALIGFCFIACGDSNEESAKTTNADSNTNQTTNLDSNATTQNTIDSNATMRSTIDSNATAESSAESNVITKTPQDLYKKCVACHGSKGDKVAPGSIGDMHIASLDKSEIINALKGYRAKNFSKGGSFAIMYLQAQDLSDNDINTLADYISSFKNNS